LQGIISRPCGRNYLFELNPELKSSIVCVNMNPVYEGNPKHKEPWQPGRKGSLCPKDVTLERARELLDSSVENGSARYAADKGRAFCARQHNRAKNRWHGYPVAWKEVPSDVRQELIAKGKVLVRDVKKYWETSE
jgi:hypothetical protein